MSATAQVGPASPTPRRGTRVCAREVRRRAARPQLPTHRRPNLPWQKMDELIGGLGSKLVELSQDKWMKLAISILIDIIGILTYLIPVVRQRVFLLACVCARA